MYNDYKKRCRKKKKCSTTELCDEKIILYESQNAAIAIGFSYQSVCILDQQWLSIYH